MAQKKKKGGVSRKNPSSPTHFKILKRGRKERNIRRQNSEFI